MSVEPVEADGDRLIPGAALGSVCGECVGVGDVTTAVQVPAVDGDRGVAVEPDGQRAGFEMRDRAGFSVGDGLCVAFGGLFGAVAADHDPVTDAVVAVVVAGSG